MKNRWSGWLFGLLMAALLIALPGEKVLAEEDKGAKTELTGMEEAELRSGDQILADSPQASTDGEDLYGSVSVDVTYMQTNARSMLSMVNKLRTGSDAWYYNEDGSKKVLSGLGKLTYDYNLEKIAMQRAAELILSFSHTRPDGTSCFTAYTVGSFTAMGENIAYGYNMVSTAAEAFDEWCETNEDYYGQGHRRNMLNQGFNAIGIAGVKIDLGGGEVLYYWVQEFGKTSSPNTTATTAVNTNKTVGVVLNLSRQEIESIDASPKAIVTGIGMTVDAPEATLTIQTVDSWPFAWEMEFVVKPTWKKASTATFMDVQSGRITGKATGKGNITTTVNGTTVTASVEIDATPTLNLPYVNSAGDVVLEWSMNGYSSTDPFQVFRKNGSAGWAKLQKKNASANGKLTGSPIETIVDKTAQRNVKYTYTVRKISADGKTYTSNFNSTGVSITPLATPVLKSVAPARNGLKVTWGAVKGAERYIVYRKSGSGSWSRIADNVTTNSYTDTTAKAGTTYTYTIRCLSKDGKQFVSGYDTVGKSGMYIAEPVLSTISRSRKGITLTWKASAGAAKYRVYRKSGNGDWARLTDTTKTTITDSTVKYGTTYAYTVRVLSADGSKLVSSYDTKGLSLLMAFEDVTESSKYYYNPVNWAANQGVSKGYEDNTFRPENECTRGEMVTFLWRVSGKPEPTLEENPFSDVSEEDYYYKAVLWAAETGITKGYDDGTFRPGEVCLREHAATFLWRAAGKPEPETVENPFNDVTEEDYYYRAALWANEKGIAKGYSEGENAGGYGPKVNCLREHIVTFLYRYAKQ